jgi:L-seryl-tRNA(Ser) seleniumtransferase
MGGYPYPASVANLRQLPSIDQLLQRPQVGEWIAIYGRSLTVNALRDTLDRVRTHYPQTSTIPDETELIKRAGETLKSWSSPSLQPVINATGVVLHTNLGRAPLSQAALQAVQEVALGYSNLEYDLEKGQRGSRLVHADALLRRLTGAEAALVVNNNAAAVLLVLTCLARRRVVVIARSQLVEIGGGFRVPDVMKQSGARLLEVGTTNRVHLSDYESALEESPALFLRAHRSNFRILGFTSEPSLAELAVLAHQAGLPLVDDLGSGALLDTARFGLGHEPMVQESLAAGADLVCFSGDKLLGGPQAGIIIGRLDLLDRIKKHPLARAIRADKLCLAALSATLLHYLKDEAEQAIPTWRMISATIEEIRLRARSWVTILGQGQVVPGESTIGGGSLPEETLPTYLISLSPPSPNRLLTRLRQLRPPIIARLENDCLVLDPRTVLPEQEPALLSALDVVLGEKQGG